MKFDPRVHLRAALPALAAGTALAPASLALGGLTPAIILEGDYDVVYEFDLEQVNGLGPLDVDDTVFFAKRFADSYIDTNPASSIFQSQSAISSGIFMIVDGETGTEDVAYLDQGSLFGLHGNPFRDEVETYISADDMTSSFVQYGALVNFTVSMTGPFGIFDYGAGELDISHMFEGTVLDQYDVGEFSGELFNGQTFSGDVDIRNVPAPSALGLFGITVLAASRRRG